MSGKKFLGLIGDIGGTNARLAKACEKADGTLICEHVENFACVDYSHPAEAIEHYLTLHPEVGRPDHAVIAIAGLILDDEIKMTNHGWRFSVSDLKDRMGLLSLEVINDLKAMSLGVPHIAAENLTLIGPSACPEVIAAGTFAVVAPGTGLGVGGLVQDKGVSLALNSEGGHIEFAPCEQFEVEIARVLLQEYPRLSYERILSGFGIRNLYRAIAEVDGLTADDLTPEEITSKALAGSDPLCRRTLEQFCAILGSLAGDIVLTVGAQGAFIGGGIVPNFIDFLRTSRFRERFENKGRHSPHMVGVPTWIILDKCPGLRGAASQLRKNLAV